MFAACGKTILRRASAVQVAGFHSTGQRSAKIVCALYDDPIQGYPPKYARDSIPVVPFTSDVNGRGFKPGELLGSVSGGLGLRSILEKAGHTFVVTSDKDGPNSVFEREMVDADVVISQPFWPAYITEERMKKSPKLKLCITAGIGSDHVDLEAANKRKITVAEVTFCNSISVAEHVVMQILALVRNYIPSYNWVLKGGWNIADCVERSYDVEGMHIGTIAAGRIGYAVMKRLYPFNVNLHYTERHRLSADQEKAVNAKYHESVPDMIKDMDVVTINCPLHPQTEYMFNRQLIAKMKRGSYIVNTARGKICDENAIADALKSGHLAGYAGDVWFPQPPPRDHPWRTMPHHAMTPHISGTSLSAQARYAAGVHEILDCFLNKKPYRNEYLIAHEGKLAGVGAVSYMPGNTTGGSADAIKFKQ